ncbi:MAG: hypothetical protein ACTSYF_00425 [Promethearchaeota archaeon]
MLRAKPIIKRNIEEFKSKFKRDYHGLIESYRCGDAEYILVTVGALAEQVKDVVDILRKDGQKVGSIKVRYFRPFPEEDLISVLKSGDVRGIAVVDRSIAYGSTTGGHLSSEMYRVINKLGHPVTYLPAVWGLGGRDVTLEDQKSVFEALEELDSGKKISNKRNYYHGGTLWINLK